MPIIGSMLTPAFCQSPSLIYASADKLERVSKAIMMMAWSTKKALLFKIREVQCAAWRPKDVRRYWHLRAYGDAALQRGRMKAEFDRLWRFEASLILEPTSALVDDVIKCLLVSLAQERRAPTICKNGTAFKVSIRHGHEFQNLESRNFPFLEFLGGAYDPPGRCAMVVRTPVQRDVPQAWSVSFSNTA
jgi:hypothetical protein